MEDVVVASMDLGSKVGGQWRERGTCHISLIKSHDPLPSSPHPTRVAQRAPKGTSRKECAPGGGEGRSHEVGVPKPCVVQFC